jgi:hypothetical protein
LLGFRRIKSFRNLLIPNPYDDFQDLPKENQLLYNSIIKDKASRAEAIGSTLYTLLKKK